MILVFGPLTMVEPSDVAALAFPLLLAFLFGLAGLALFAGVAGRLLGYTVPMSIGIGLTALYGFPGTMVLSQEAAKGVGETPEEAAAVEGGDSAQDDRRRLLDRDDHHCGGHQHHRRRYRRLRSGLGDRRCQERRALARRP